MTEKGSVVRYDWVTDLVLKVRRDIIRILKGEGYKIEEAPNPARLNIRKGDELFIMDIFNNGSVWVNPILFVPPERLDGRGVVVTDIPPEGEIILNPKYDVVNENSIYYSGLKEVLGKIGYEFGEGTGNGLLKRDIMNDSITKEKVTLVSLVSICERFNELAMRMSVLQYIEKLPSGDSIVDPVEIAAELGFNEKDIDEYIKSLLKTVIEQKLIEGKREEEL
ncbi:MAG: hypothetical protein ACTSRU_14195 [Candidatus Hodarchaeales archaeon]